MVMVQTLDTHEFQSRLARLEALLVEVDLVADPALQARMREMIQAVLDLHGVALQRIIDHLTAAGDPGASILDACAHDDLAAGLLLLHGLHPVGLHQRVLNALDQVRPYLRSHHGDVELLDVTHDGAVKLRLVGNCHGCPSSAVTMKQTVEEAILAHAPDVTSLEVEGTAEAPSTTPDGRPLVALALP
jgi:Fe-S cluster biogenesis protein NfuA